MSAVAARAHVRRGRAELAARPRHVLLAAFGTGLLAAGAPRPLALGLAAFALLVPGRVALGALAAAVLLLGAATGAARREAAAATALRPALGPWVKWRGEVQEAPRARKFGGAAARVRLTSGLGAGEQVVVVTAKGTRWPPRALGAEVEVSGRLRRLAKWEAFQRPRGAHAGLDADGLRATGRRRRGLLGAVDAARRRAEDALTARLPAREGALARGMVLGQDEAVDRRVREDFRVAGLAHVLAASGQNVVLLAALALPVLAVLGLGLRGRLLALLGLIAVYVPLAGGGPSIQRAGIMGAAGVAATLAGRPASKWYAIGLAAAGTLLLSPFATQEPGWQLSFAAVIAMALGAPRLTRALSDRGCPRPLAVATALTVAATLGTAPLLAHHFGQVSLAALPVNVLAAPVVAGVMWVGMAACALAQAAPGLAAVVTLLAVPALGFLEALAHLAASVPHAAVELAEPGPLAVAGLYGAAALLLAVPRLRLPATGLGAAAATVALAWPARGAAAPPPPGEVRVSFLDVGQGDATLVQTSDAALLVDAGRPEGGILRRLEQAGVGRLDLAVATHDQDDHSGGLPTVLRRRRVDLLLDGGSDSSTPAHAALVAAARARGVRRVAPDAGQTIALGRTLRFTVLSPEAEPAELHAGADPNLRSIVARVSAGAFDLLLTADAESEATGGLSLPAVEALKVPHHGSEDPGLPETLGQTRPRMAVIEVGRRNTYGHPTPQALGALRAARVPTYRTDRDGTVTLTASEADGSLRVATARGRGQD